MSIILTTRTKVAGARILYRSISTTRSLVGLRDRVQVRRAGVNWSLDLNEGIDLSIYLFGMFERSTVNVLRKMVRPGDAVLDIGANIGAHTLHLARSAGEAGRVFAFEPTDFAFIKLQLNIDLNPQLKPRISADQIMLADDAAAPNPESIYSSWPLDQSENLHEKHQGRRMTTRNARVERLDDYIRRNAIDRIDVIKIDVDGHEFPVLSGGAESLRRFRPRILMELSPYIHQEEGYRFEDLIALFRDCGYSMTAADSGKALPMDAALLSKIVPDGASINVILEANGG